MTKRKIHSSFGKMLALITLISHLSWKLTVLHKVFFKYTLSEATIHSIHLKAVVVIVIKEILHVDDSFPPIMVKIVMEE